MQIKFVKKLLLAALIPLLFWIGFCYLSSATPALSGYIVKQNQWNNWGYELRLYKEGELHNTTQTSLNGFFAFSDIGAGAYSLYVFDQQLLLYRAELVLPRTEPLIAKLSEPNPPGVYSFETIGFLIALLVFVIGLLLWSRNRIKPYSLYFLLITIALALLNAVEFFQVVLANLGQELWAARIFPLKHIGLSWIGPTFVLFWAKFPEQKQNHRSNWQTLLLPVVAIQSLVLLSWMLLGSDNAFLSCWGFEYSFWRALLVIQTALFIFVGCYYLFKNSVAERNFYNRERFAVLKIVMSLLLTVVICFVFVPVVFLQGRELMGLPYGVVVSLLSLIFVSLVYYVSSCQRVVAVSKIFRGSVVYSLLTFSLAVVYSLLIVFLDKIFVLQYENHLINAYLLAFFIVIAFPLKDRLQRLMDSFFWGDITQQKASLVAFSKGLSNYGDKKTISKLFIDELKSRLGLDFAFLQEVKDMPKNIIAAAEAGFLNIIGSHQKESELAIPVSGRKVRAYLLVGNKKNGLGLSDQDVEIIEAATHQLAVALDNALLYESLLLAERQSEQNARLAALGALAAGLAHEIKNPMTAINNLVKLLPQKYTSAEFRESFEQIVPRQINRINELLRNLLDFSKPSQLKFSPLDVNEVVQKAVQLVAVSARKANIKVVVRNAAETLKISGDASALEQVFVNLFLNAIDAMATGGSLVIEQKGNAIWVKDTGSGIPVKLQKHIFDPFMTTKATGHGFGLSISKRILDQQGILISLNSTKKGTVFKLQFPS